MIEETPNAKWNRALRFVLSETQSPNRRLEALAHEEEFYHEYLWIKDRIVEHLHTLWRHENV